MRHIPQHIYREHRAHRRGSGTTGPGKRVDMLLDFQMHGKRALVIGAGEVGIRKAVSLAEDGASVTVLSKEFTDSARDACVDHGIRTVVADLAMDSDLALTLLPSHDFLVVATDDATLNKRLAGEARRLGTIVSVVDDMGLSDCAFPAISNRGGISIAVSTGGRSPTMARQIRDRLAGTVTDEDVIMLALHEHVRGMAKSLVGDALERKDLLLRVTKDELVVRKIQGHDLEGAKQAAEDIIRGRR